jgi:hypothetical protein
MRKFMLLALTVAFAPAVHASQAQVHVVEGMKDLASGELEGAAVTPDARVSAAPQTKLIATGLSGPVLAVARGSDGALYAATAAPGRVWRIKDGAAAEQLWETDKPLITALLPLSKGRLVAITAPEGGAEVIDVATKKSVESVVAKDAKMLLAGAVIDDTVYAVGGGEEGLVLKLAPGAKAFETVAKTKEPQLRSIAVRKIGGALKIVVGGSEEGVVYDVAAGKVRALIDATPAEITALAIGDDGTVFAAAVDGEGKLSKGAFSKAKEDSSGDDDEKKKKQKARKVKGAEVWRIDAATSKSAGRAMVLWQSKDHGAYALAIMDGRLFAGTGPEGRIYEIDPKGGRAAGVLTRIKDHDEVTSLFVDATGLVLGTSHAAAVATVSKARAATATYLSPALDSEGLARYGAVTARTHGAGAAKLSVRTGNTKEPDDTWSAWSATPGGAPAGQYAQVRAELSGAVALEALTLSYLVDNRAPEIDRVEVLAPGWKVIASNREPSESRSVTFNEKPFSKYLDRRGGQNPTLDERPFGKQSFDPGYRTVYAYVEDPDKDALRYRFTLGKVESDGSVRTWTQLKDWSEEPFVSFEASRLADGEYKVQAFVDDSPTNGPARRLNDDDTSAAFVVSHAPPKLSGAVATRAGKNVRVKLEVASALPLTVVRCSAAGEEWLPIDPKDGIVDGKSESFDVEMDSGKLISAVSCEVYDEALNFNRIDIPIAGVGG